MPTFLRSTLLIILLSTVSLFAGAQQHFWQDVTEAEFTQTASQKKTITPNEFRAVKLNSTALLAALQTAPREFTTEAGTRPLILTLPTPDGGFARFAVVYSPMMEPQLEAEFPNIRTYNGQGIDDPAATLKLDWTEFGLHAQVLSPTAEPYYIDPYVVGETTQYMSYAKKDLPVRHHIEHSVIREQVQNMSGMAQRTNSGLCFGTSLRIYRLAVACTGEYAVAVGGSGVTVSQALSAITTTINRVNGIYESELAMRLVLVGNNSSIVFTNPSTDPFTGNNNADILINQSQSVIDANIGSANYDVGHTFSTGAGGLAQSPAACISGSKARGVTGSPQPFGDAFDVDYVAHELGHQFSGSHTFNATTVQCGGSNRMDNAAVEPGSGITIMAYAGLCGTNNLANNSIPYFHAFSQNEIRTYVTSGFGSSCGTPQATGNSLPIVNAGPDYTIPAGTPFVLTGSASDVNNSEVLTYSWEQMDLGVAGDWNSGNRPFFRSFAPTLTPTRYFPQLSNVLSGTMTVGEFLPLSNQTMTFRLTARDNRAGGGGVCSDDAVVTVNGSAGPFVINSQWGNPEQWTAGNTAAISWNVAGTNVAPINAANVSILFSADGGQTFPYVILASTPNDGSEIITIPSVRTNNGRIMIRAVNNIFFNVNQGRIELSVPACAAEGATIAPASTVTALTGTAALNLSLAPQFGASGTIATTDPSMQTVVNNIAAPSCIATGGTSRYDLYPFTVSVSGSYTFTHNGALGTVTNFYSNTFQANSACTNFIGSNATFNGSSVGAAPSVTLNLTTGVSYFMTVGSFSASQPVLPAAYNVQVTTGSGGNVNFSTAFNNPGAGFSYVYVVVNNANNNIVSIGSPNLSNAGTFPPGQYTVYGLSHANSISNLSSFVGGSLTALLTQMQNNPSTFCASLSKNSVLVNVTGTFPVQFTALKARKQGETVLLDWGTVTEQNSSYFEIQRSTNGRDFNTVIGKLNAAGNSNAQIDYNFTDQAPARGWNYYRIRQVDLDGRFMFSNIAAVNMEKAGAAMVLYPNPTRDQLNIEYTSERAGKLELQVIDSKGAVLIRQNVSVVAGRNIASLNVASLSQGVYMLRYVNANGEASLTRFIKQ